MLLFKNSASRRVINIALINKLAPYFTIKTRMGMEINLYKNK